MQKLIQPKTVLLQITVTSASPPTVFSYYDGKPANEPVKVNVGDSVGWVVQAAIFGARKTPPYELIFSDESFFGVPSLSVPAGGTSPFLQVLPLQSKISYSLNLTGVGCIFDPQIQSGPDNSLELKALEANPAKATFTITWDTVANSINVPGGFPLTVSLLDTVIFIATAAPGAVFAGFTINFALLPVHEWATPFNPTLYTLSASAGTPSMIFAVVSDNVEGGDPAKPLKFFFSGSIMVNGNPITSPTCEIDL